MRTVMNVVIDKWQGRIEMTSYEKMQIVDPFTGKPARYRASRYPTLVASCTAQMYINRDGSWYFVLEED